MTKSIVNTTTMFVFAGALAMAAPARADEMQVSGTSYLNQVEAHAIPAGGNPTSKSAFRIDDKTSIPKGGYEGTWELTSGTGRYANVRGRGTVKGEFTGTSAIDHWKGTITGFEKRASTQ